MEIKAQMVKELREQSGAGVMDCKEALREARGNLDEASKLLRKKGLAAAGRRSQRATREGSVGSYIHAGGRIGVLVEVNCETDFVARTDEFQKLVKNLAMHVAAAAPRFVRREEVPAGLLDREREILMEQAKSSGKPEQILEKMVEGRLEKFFAELCLEEQPFVRDPDQSVLEIVQTVAGKTGENIKVRRFSRFVLGEPGADGESAQTESGGGK